MGNEAIALGALKAGVGMVTGYPGTPSTEVLETVAKYRPDDVYVEWSVNEKAGLEVAAGAAYTGVRSMVTMKQVGLNVASDPLMSLTYVGIKGGMVIMVADDPGPISSQTEQDTRHFAAFSKLPVFDPSSPEEAYEMIQDAFTYSEKYHTPVLFRPTTRICHGCASIEIPERFDPVKKGEFEKNSKWVIFPRLTYQNHIKIEERNVILSKEFSSYRFNEYERGDGKRGMVAGGVSYIYAKEALEEVTIPILKIATTHPFPEELALRFLRETEEIIVFEELDPVIEKNLIYLCGKYHLPNKIYGKISGHTANAGENSVESTQKVLGEFLGKDVANETELKEALPSLPVRPPVLCAGCPHRASFYAVKRAMEGKKAFFSGDIGCYTLGNAAPLDMVDTCLCMGADVTIAQGMHRSEPDGIHFAFIGDSTFFASGMTGIVNAIYNQTPIVLIILDNSTTAMTGHQPHPGTGKTMMGDITEKVSIPKILSAMGISYIKEVNPMNFKEAVETVEEASKIEGVSAIIFQSPCVALIKQPTPYVVEQNCIGCQNCIAELGCPAIRIEDGLASIDPATCWGCGICAQVCPVDALKMGDERKC